MKKLLIYLMLAGGMCYTDNVFAQIDTATMAGKLKVNPNMSADYATVGTTIKELATGIDPSMMTDKGAAKKEKWLEKTSKINSYSEAAKLLGKIGGNVRLEAFVSGFSVNNWMIGLKDVNSMAEFSNAVTKLVGSMKESAFTARFAHNKANWLNSMSGMPKQ